MGDTSKRPATTRLTEEEIALLDAAVARSDQEFRSRYLRRVVREHLRDEFGDDALRGEEGETDG